LSFSLSLSLSLLSPLTSPGCFLFLLLDSLTGAAHLSSFTAQSGETEGPAQHCSPPTTAIPIPAPHKDTARAPAPPLDTTCAKQAVEQHNHTHTHPAPRLIRTRPVHPHHTWRPPERNKESIHTHTHTHIHTHTHTHTHT